MGDMSSFRIGDEVHVMFDVTEEDQDKINRSKKLDVFLSRCKVHIPCVVVHRSRSLAWVAVGEFQDLGFSMCLEASTDLWEDVLKWMIINDPPDWISETDVS